MRHRIPYAARQLINEVSLIDEEANSYPLDEIDGLGVWRTIVFDPPAAKWLALALEACNDPRIESLRLFRRKLSVTFVADTRADSPLPPFNIEVAHRVLTGKD